MVDVTAVKVPTNSYKLKNIVKNTLFKTILTTHIETYIQSYFSTKSYIFRTFVIVYF
jgi:hypothetical protein